MRIHICCHTNSAIPAHEPQYQLTNYARIFWDKGSQTLQSVLIIMASFWKNLIFSRFDCTFILLICKNVQLNGLKGKYELISHGIFCHPDFLREANGETSLTADHNFEQNKFLRPKRVDL